MDRIIRRFFVLNVLNDDDHEDDGYLIWRHFILRRGSEAPDPLRVSFAGPAPH